MLLHNYTYLLNEDGYKEKCINNISVCIITKYLSSVGKCLFMLILNTIYNDYCGNNVGQFARKFGEKSRPHWQQ